MSVSGVHVVSSAAEWSESAAQLTQTAFEGPTVKVCQDLITALDAAVSLSSATAVLDNGCGVGQVIGRLINDFGASIQNTTRLVASDISDGMIGELERRRTAEITELTGTKSNKSANSSTEPPALHLTSTSKAPIGSDSDSGESRKHRAQLWQRLETHIWDALNLSQVAANTFSHVTGGVLYMMLPSPLTALRETYRVLSPGGVLALSSFGRISWMELMGEFSRVKPELAAPQVPSLWATPEGIKQELEAAGFLHVQIQECHTYMEFEDSAMLVEGLMRVIPSAKNLTQGLSEADVKRGCQFMVDKLDREYSDSPRRLPAVALVATGRKAA